MQAIQIAPVDLVELVKAVFYGISIVFLPAVTGILMLIAHRQKKLDRKTDALNTKIDGLLVERDASNVRKGERMGEQSGRDTAIALAEGQRQGRETERASVIARGLEHNSPLPVEDEGSVATRTAEASERSANAQERVADATERKP